MATFILSNDENIVKCVRRRDIPADYYGPVISVSDSNKKLKPTAGGYNDYGEKVPSTCWLIFNLTAVNTCPFRTRHCGGYLKGETRYEIDPKTGKKIDKKAYCYAVKSENAYPTVIPARRDNLKATILPIFVDMITAIIARKLKYMKKERLIIRIHESGDFYNQVYAEKWVTVARRFENDPRVVFWAYTKSLPFFDWHNLPVNFRLRASLWDDTDPEYVKIMMDNDLPLYTVYDNELPAGYIECHCKDCGMCNQCGDPSKKRIACKRH